MEIWLWIIAAWALSYAVLDKKNIQSQHLLWMLLPVDMYGINLFGFTLKPYMIFCLLLLLKRIAEGRKKLSISSNWLLQGLFPILACIIMNTISTRDFGGIMSTTMMLVVWGCCLIYMGECDRSCRGSICRILQATGIGHGVVFVLAYLVMQINPEFPGVTAMERSLPGIFMRNANVINGTLTAAFRLRGFTVDPNTIAGTFLYCTVISVLQIVERKATARDVLGVILSVVCILLSGSRMGLICLLLCVAISLWAGHSIDAYRTRRLLLLSAFILFVVMVFMLLTGTLQSAITSLLDNYSNRSELSGDYGRFTIWQEALSIWVNEGLLVGLGMGQMQYYTSMQRACHNSWLEILCAWGALVGGTLIIHLFTPVISGLHRMITRKSTRKDFMFWTMLLGTMGVMASLFTVDNITYSYLWFGIAMVAALAAGNWKEDTQ